MAESRCPSDVVCITAGEVSVILRIIESLPGSGYSARTDFGLTLGGLALSVHLDDGVYYRLVEANPYPDTTVEVSDEDYNIVLEYSSLPFK